MSSSGLSPQGFWSLGAESARRPRRTPVRESRSSRVPSTLSSGDTPPVPPFRDATITLADGRRLAYAEWGDPDGSPVFLFHGTPHSRLWCPDEPATEAAGVRLITVDRPGIGRSDVKIARTLGDWPADVVALAEALGIARFPVVGYSGGGIYAAACAAKIPSRLSAVGIVSARHLAEFNIAERPGTYEELDNEDRAMYDLAQHDPVAAGELAAQQNEEWVRGLQKRPESIWDGPPEARAPEGDKWFWADETLTRPFFAALREGLRQGTDGYRWEEIDVWLPWGFRLDEIPMRVHLWYGEQDSRFSGTGRELIDFVAARIPDCHVIRWPDAGHLGIAKHWHEILDTVAPASS